VGLGGAEAQRGEHRVLQRVVHRASAGGRENVIERRYVSNGSTTIRVVCETSDIYLRAGSKCRSPANNSSAPLPRAFRRSRKLHTEKCLHGLS
jgi:hypothetical protein